ncbi:MAG: WYL domain-containing protein, partial [Bacteroidota bacterium]|nr:WYL domain-containing protein [Bacteroidota bacterium]
VIKSAEQNAIVDKMLPLLLRSVSDKEMLQITYTVLDPANTKSYMVEPIGIFNENAVWNTIAYNHHTENYRNYRIDRISQIKRTGKPFSKTHISLKEYLETQRKQETVYKPVITIKKDVVHYIEEQKYRYGFVSETEKGDEVEIIFQTTCLQTFSRWFLTIADNAKIIEPQELKVILNEIVMQISKNL